MAFSRFYNAPQYQYVSQFVPRNLAVMDQALARSQKTQDEEADKMSKTYDAYLKQGALTGPDTEARDKLVEEVKSFSASMANQDLTQAANRRKIAEFTQGMINNPVREKLNLGLASKAKYDKIKEDLITKGDYATENDRIFVKKFDEYLKQTGEDKKFAIDFIGGNELIEKNAPSRPELEKFVDNIHSSGYTYDNERGTWIDRKSKKGVSFDHINSVLNLNANPFFKTNAGKQMLRRAKDYGMSPVQIFQEEITPIAAERAWSETSNTFRDNTAHLLNKKKLDAQEIPLVTQPLNTVLTTHGVTNLVDYDKKINEFRAAAAQSPSSSEGIKARKQAEYLTANRDKMLNTLVAGNDLDKNELGVLKMNYQTIENSPNLLKQMYKASFPVEVEGIGGDKPLAYYQAELKKLEKENPGYLDQLSKVVVAQSLGLDYKEIEKKIDDAVAKGVGIQKEEVLLPVERQGDKKKIGVAAVTLLDNINFENSDIKTDETEEIDFREVAKLMSPSSISVVKEDGRVGISFSTKAVGDTPSRNYEVYPKVGSVKELSSAFDNLLKFYAKNPADYKMLRNEFESAEYRPVGRNSLYSQTSDMGLDPKVIGDWNIQYPQAGESQSGVVLNNPTYGILTYKDALDHVNTFRMSAQEKQDIIDVLTDMNPKGNLNKTSAAVFSSPIMAQRFLKDIQNQEEKKHSK